MKIFLTGGKGQLGQTLNTTLPEGYDLLSQDIGDFDLTDAEQVLEKVEAYRPDVIINTAAYTKVDLAEDESGLARLVNAEGAANIAKAAKSVGARLIHISTDYVFSGEANTPYSPDAECSPRSVYGESKLEGERLIESHYAEKTIVIRTAWVYSNFGANFLLTMLRLMGQEDREGLGVVADQVGTPTSTYTLAELIWKIVASEEERGIYHCTDLGVASWYDFAVAIGEEALERGLIAKAMPIKALTTEEYPTKAVRPRYSVLDKGATVETFGQPRKHWRVALRDILEKLS